MLRLIDNDDTVPPAAIAKQILLDKVTGLTFRIRGNANESQLFGSVIKTCPGLRDLRLLNVKDFNFVDAMMPYLKNVATLKSVDVLLDWSYIPKSSQSQEPIVNCESLKTLRSMVRKVVCSEQQPC